MISADLWHIQIPLIEKVIRTVLVYAGLAVLLRLGGKRDLAQLNSFDLVVMLLLSNVVQNAVIGPDNSLAGGLLGAAVLIAVNGVTVRLVNRHAWLVKLFEGTETVVIEDGRPLTSVITRLGLRIGDLAAVLRRQGADDVSQVRRAVMSPGGALVVSLKDDAQDLTRGDLRSYPNNCATTSGPTSALRSGLRSVTRSPRCPSQHQISHRRHQAIHRRGGDQILPHIGGPAAGHYRRGLVRPTFEATMTPGMPRGS